MKKLLIAIAFAAFASNAMAAIALSAHDFTDNFGASGARTGQVCIYCHAPHATNPADPNLPLWNRAYTATSAYTQYAAPLASGHSANTSNFTTGTRACLSCHDGSTTDVSVTYAYGDISTSTLGASGVNNIGTDLRNDHPIGMQYYTAAIGAVGGYYTPPTTLPFYTAAGAPGSYTTDYMQCSTCHEVHNTYPANSYLLRMTQLASAICVACHNK